jgi:REP element-mobilizing transposase RayT
MPSEPKGWYSRGYLPHLDTPDVIQSVTFRLADSLPAAVAAALLESKEPERDLDDALDRCIGACHLGDAKIADVVERSMLHFDGERYRLLAWCVMPNHVHALIEPIAGFALADVVGGWKSFTAKQANRLLKRDGSFWRREYFDRYIRDEHHFAIALAYIENNPVKAGLVSEAGDWRWSSARYREEAGGTPAVP